jgi:hypothetical protein
MMEQGDTRHGRSEDGTANGAHRLPENLLGLRVRITVECANHGSHTCVMVGPFMRVIDLITLFREVSSDHDRWVVCEYAALDHQPPMSISDWV